MKQKLVGVYRSGNEDIELVLRKGTGGALYFRTKHSHVARIRVGADLDKWREVVSVLLHEIFELQMDRKGCRFDPSDDRGQDHGAYLFVMTHQQFSDVAAKSAQFVFLALPDLARAWKKWKRKGKP